MTKECDYNWLAVASWELDLAYCWRRCIDVRRVLGFKGSGKRP